MESILSKKSPVVVTDNAGQKMMLPSPEILSKFEILHYFLDEVIADWQRASTPYQMEIKAAKTEGEALTVALRGFSELQRVFLKCVFSYVLFFCATEAAYEVVYDQLNRANHFLNLHLKHSKPPKRDTLIKKVRRIRNWSITHIGSTKGRSIDAFSAIDWQPLTLGKSIGDPWHLDGMRFGSFRRVMRRSDGSVLEESDDIELPGIPTLHVQCSDYLRGFDMVCAQYLDALNREDSA